MPDLWSLKITAVPDLVPQIELCLEEEALALSILSPPRTAQALVEGIFDHPPDLEALHAQIAILAQMANAAQPTLALTKIPDIDWMRKVASDFPPRRIARWTVHGAEHRAAVTDRRYALQIDAINAFGTGEHPTTRGCLTLLDRVLRLKNQRWKTAADIGCGSGILAMAFVQATKGQAVAVDLDPVAVSITRFNARVNKLQNHIHAGLSNGYRAPLVGARAPYDLILSNIFAGPLCQLAPDLRRHLRPQGYAILAGLLTTQANRVIAAHRHQGLTLRARITDGEWTILALQRD